MAHTELLSAHKQATTKTTHISNFGKQKTELKKPDYTIKSRFG
jgi:hypothetical protein